VVGVDVDDTVCNLIGGWIPAINRDFGLNVRLDQITEWLLADCTPELKAIGDDRLAEYFGKPGFHLNLDPMPGAIESLRRLSKDYRLYFITARHGPLAISETFDWFKKHLRWVQHKQIIFAREKHIFQLDAAIDDKLDHLKGFRMAPHLAQAKVLGVERPHNLRERTPDVAHFWFEPSVTGWNAAVDYLYTNVHPKE
jgi:5'(3')-deoxyribonucleotidase